MYKLIPLKLAFVRNVWLQLEAAFKSVIFFFVSNVPNVIKHRAVCIFTFGTFTKYFVLFCNYMLNCRQYRRLQWLSFHNTKVRIGIFFFFFFFWCDLSIPKNALYAVTAPTQCQNRKTVTQAGYAPSECRGLGLRAATGLISFGGHWKQ